MEKPTFEVGRLGGPVNPATDIIPGTNRHLMAVNTGVSITGADRSGAALTSMDAPLISLGEPGLWKYSMDYVPAKASVFVNLYNNMWNTNFPYWTEGSWSERVRIWGIQPGAKITENLAVQSWETRLPLMGVKAGGMGTKLPSQQKGIAVSRKGVLVTAFGQDPDGNKGTLLRLWEEAGVHGKVKVTLPKGTNFSKAQPVDLRGEKAGEPVEITARSFEIDLGAYAPESFILK